MIVSAVCHRAPLLLLTLTLALGCLLARPADSAAAGAPSPAVRSLVFALDLHPVAVDQQAAILAETARVFAERLAALGVTDPDIRPNADDSLIVSVPENADLPEVSATLNGRGIVDFREQDESGTGWKPLLERDASGELRAITSAYFNRRSRVVLDPAIRQPLVAFEFDDDGARLFEAATRRLIGQPLAIFYDEQLVASPRVQSVISREGVIAGLSQPDARRLTIQLNSGSLPAPVYVRIE
jgi:preprotein translocase subunit SecD